MLFKDQKFVLTWQDWVWSGLAAEHIFEKLVATAEDVLLFFALFENVQLS